MSVGIWAQMSYLEVNGSSFHPGTCPLMKAFSRRCPKRQSSVWDVILPFELNKLSRRDPCLPLYRRQNGKEKQEQKRGTKNQGEKTYNSRYSLVVTHPTTNLPI
jgi:hypothetical protein